MTFDDYLQSQPSKWHTPMMSDGLRQAWEAGKAYGHYEHSLIAQRAEVVPLDLSPPAADLMVDHYISDHAEFMAPPDTHGAIREAVQGIFQQLRIQRSGMNSRP